MRRTGQVLAAVALAVGVPAVAVATTVAAYNDLISRHPVIAALLVIGYECLVLLVALLSKVVSGPIDRRARQLGDFVDAALGRRMSRYGRYYRRHVRESLRFTQTMGMGIV